MLERERWWKKTNRKVTTSFRWWEEGVLYLVESYGGRYCILTSRDGRGRMLYRWRVFANPSKCGSAISQTGAYLMSFVSRSKERALSSGDPSSFEDSTFRDECPALWEYLTAREIDGQAREPATITLFASDGAWKVFINDKDQGRFACVTAGSWSDLWPTVELQLQEDTADWRSSNFTKRKGGK